MQQWADHRSGHAVAAIDDDSQGLDDVPIDEFDRGLVELVVQRDLLPGSPSGRLTQASLDLGADVPDPGVPRERDRPPLDELGSRVGLGVVRGGAHQPAVVMSVKSESPSRPGGCSCRKRTPLCTVQRPPSADASLQRAADTGADCGMAVLDLVENGDRPQAWVALQQRHYLADPLCQIAGSRRRRPRGTFFLRWQPVGIVFQTIGGGGALTRLWLWQCLVLWFGGKLIYSLIWQSVTWRPGKLRFLIGVKNPLPIDLPRPPENTAPCGTPPVAKFALRLGYALPSSLSGDISSS